MQHTTHRLSNLKYCLLLLSLFSFDSSALKDDTDQPLHITSKEQIADFESNKAIFLHNVVAIQGTIEVHGDKAELYRDENGKVREIITYGKPATYKQLQENGKIIHSLSSIIHYLPERSEVILIGRATIWQENSHVDGERIVYNTVTKQVKATNESTKNGRVQSTFIPQELKDDDKKSANSTAEAQNNQNNKSAETNSTTSDKADSKDNNEKTLDTDKQDKTQSKSTSDKKETK